MRSSLFVVLLSLALLTAVANAQCSPCYKSYENENCKQSEDKLDHYTMHMSVHPHLDAFWIFDFQSYYNPKPNEYQVHSYFAQNRFNSVKEIFDTITKVLGDSKQFREKEDPKSQKGQRSFFNSEMGFFKRWYFEQTEETKKKVKELLNTKYWEIVGGGYVEHDEGCAYYDDIIENYQMGLRFLKQNFDYTPKAAVSADSFGHSQSTLAILAHIGVEGYFVERSDEHILLQNKTQFIWKAKSANGKYYGALPTHIRWAIHGFEDQFIGGPNKNELFCQTKEMYIGNMRRENDFLKRILKSTHIMRYFGHDFQQFNDYSYSLIQGIMEEFSKEKCNKILAVYGNPTQYFKTLMGEVWKNKIKPVATRSEDIMPIWDYDSGLYWTGYYTTDPYHKKDYRDAGRLLHLLRKAFLPSYISSPKSSANLLLYDGLETLAEQVAYAQHHDGISGTSKYTVMDELEKTLDEHIEKVAKPIMKEVFQTEFPINTNNPVFYCEMDGNCNIPAGLKGDIYLKIFNSAGDRDGEPIKIGLPFDEYYKPDCDYEMNCLCYSIPCNCTLYLYPRLFTYTPVRMKKVQPDDVTINLLAQFSSQKYDGEYSFNETHFKMSYSSKNYAIGYKKIIAQATDRNYDHLSRYGTLGGRRFSIRSGKYALGNNPNKTYDFSSIRKVHVLQSPKLRIFIVKWQREHLKTVITVRKDKPNIFKVETHSAAEAPNIQDMYLEVGTEINNMNVFYTDSNGWLVMERTLFKHEDYQAFFSQQKYDDVDGNSYPMTAFAYLEGSSDKVSVNTDRPQGVIAYRSGILWINFDRLSTDDGKWVYETTYRSEYQKFTHWITVANSNYNERKIQTLYDQPLYMQGNLIQPNERVEQADYDFGLRDKWAEVAGLDGLKMLIKPWNDTTVTVRVHNLDDKNPKKVGISAGNISPLLTTFYGNQIKFKSVEESSLGGNLNYNQFLKKKWNWQEVVDLSIENEIFDKTFSENITLRPLQIRTFTFTGLEIIDDCGQPSKLSYANTQERLKLDLSKAMPTINSTNNEKEIIDYLLNGNHCTGQSPVLMNLAQKEQTPSTPKHEQLTRETPPEKPNKPVEPPKQTTPVEQSIEEKPAERPREEPKKPKHAEEPPKKPQQKPVPNEKSHHSNEPKNPSTHQIEFSGGKYSEVRDKMDHLSRISRPEKYTYFYFNVVISAGDGNSLRKNQQLLRRRRNE